MPQAKLLRGQDSFLTPQNLSLSQRALLKDPMDIQKTITARSSADAALTTDAILTTEVYGVGSSRAVARSEELFNLRTENTELVRSYIKKNGWPTIKDIGRDTWEDFIYITQHSDHDPAFQAEILAHLKANPETDPRYNFLVTRLEDRVLVNHGEEQLYGTQFIRKDGDSVWSPCPIKDPENLDARRSALGLCSMAELTAKINDQHD